MVSELQALTSYLEISECSTVVYIGAAPGDHIHVLSLLFPQLEFHLYDKRNFDKRLYKNDKIHINKRYFNEEDIIYWKNHQKRVFLISDIRTLDYIRATDEDSEIKADKITVDDMKLQEKWVIEIKPFAALLKFRLPFSSKEKKFKYLDGSIMRQVYQGNSSAETRLLVKGIAHRDWDIGLYERKLAYHNQIVRGAKFVNPLTGRDEPVYKNQKIENDFDSICTTYVLLDYLEKINYDKTEANVNNFLYYILNNCSSTERNKLLDKIII